MAELRLFYQIDQDGLYIGDVMHDMKNEVPENYLDVRPDGLFQPKWNRSTKKWEEGLDPIEVQKRKDDIEKERNRETPEERATRLEEQLQQTQSILNNLMFGGMSL